MSRQSLKNVIRLIDCARTDLPPEQNFLNDLKRSIEILENKNTRKPSQSYKPSSMNCIRNMWYQVTGAEPDESHMSYVLAGIVHSGSDIHERVQTAVSKMRENGIDCEYVDVAEFVKSRGLDNIQVISRQGMETKLFHKSLNMSFLTDGIIRYKGKYYILEIKTETSNKWISRKDVDPKHHNQATAYSMAFNIDEVIFVYINRDMLDMKSFMFNVTPEMKEELLGKIEKCDEYVRKKRVPPRPKEASGKFCQYCSYRGTCGV